MVGKAKAPQPRPTPTLTRRASRPTSLHITKNDDWTSNVVVEPASPENLVSNQNLLRLQPAPNGLLPEFPVESVYVAEAATMSPGQTSVPQQQSPSSAAVFSDSGEQQDSLIRQDSQLTPVAQQRKLLGETAVAVMRNVESLSSFASDPESGGSTTATATGHSINRQRQESRSSTGQNYSPNAQPMKSPCFVHSCLNGGVGQTLAEWAKGKSNSVGVAKSLEGAQPLSPSSIRARQHDLTIPHHHNFSNEPFYPSSPSNSPSEYEDDDGVGSLTRQLAETAVSVREMSKQLGER